MSAARLSALVLAAMAAGLAWLDWMLSSAGDQAAIWAGAMLVAPLLIALGRARSALLRLALGLLALLPTLVLAQMLMAGAGVLVHWPLAVSALAAGLSIITLCEIERLDPVPLAVFPLGAALLALVLGLLTEPVSPLRWPEAAALLQRTAVHLALSGIGAMIAAGLLLAALRRSLAPRGRRLIAAMIGLLPLLGFTGTILGIMQTLAALPAVFDAGTGAAGDLVPVLSGLSTAFETTLIGLVAAVAAGLALALLDAILGSAEA
jgi:hypothetical protein